MPEPLTLLATFGVGFGATFLFVATGGVGMITVPALVFLGLSPQAAIATDLFALFGGRIGGLLGLWREGRVDVRLGLRLGAVTAVGALGGAFTLLAVPGELMKRLLAGFLLVLLALVLALPRVGVETAPEISPRRQWLGSAGFLVVGFWGTLVGAGFLNIGGALLLLVFRKSFLQTAGVLTIVGLAAACSALVVFGSRGTIVWPLGFAMLAGKTAGGYLGARAAARLGDRRIRWLFVAVVLASAARLLWG